MCVHAVSKEKIIVLNPQGAGYSGTPQFLATIDELNRIQKKYQFISEFKVGGFESIALREVKNNPQTHITTVVTTHIEANDRGLITLGDYVPVFANGDACWVLASNFGDEKQGLKSLSGPNSPKEIVVGAPALGGALHLMALEIGKKINKPVRFVFYKTNNDAVIAMMQGDVNLTLDRVRVFESYKSKFPNIAILASTCGQRHQDARHVKTLDEQGYDVPPIFNVVIASKDMDLTRRQEIRKLFEDATMNLGQEKLISLGDHVPAVFQNKDSEKYYFDMVKKHQLLRQKWKTEVDASR